MKRKLKKLSLVLGLILMASFTIGISKVSAAETKAIKFESRCVMEAIKKSDMFPKVTDDMVDLENLTLNLTQKQIDSVKSFRLGASSSYDEENLYLDTEKNIVEIEGVEYKKISLKGIENFKNIESINMYNAAYGNLYGQKYLDPKFHIQIDLSELEKNTNIAFLSLDQDNFDYLNIESIGKLPNLCNLSIEYVGNEVLKTKSIDISKIFPLTTKNEQVRINIDGCTFSDEEKMWNYIASNPDKKFWLSIMSSKLTHIPSLKNVEIASLYGNNIESIGDVANIDTSTGIYNIVATLEDISRFVYETDINGNRGKREDGKDGLNEVSVCSIPLCFQRLNEVTDNKSYDLPKIFETALKIDKYSYQGGDAKKFSELAIDNDSYPSWWSDGTKLEVVGATLSADNKQVIFADDAKDGDVATVEVLGGIAHGTKLTLTYKAPVQEEKPAEDNKESNADDKKEETIIDKVYNFLEGANQTYKKGDNTEVKFRIDGSLELFDKAYVDSIKLDKSSYTLEEGSTIIKLNNDYVNTLSNGKHELSVSYTDGKTATTSFTILAPDFKQNPDTGVTSLLAIQAVKI